MKYDKINENDEYYTPPEVFEALECIFDTDIAAPINRTFCHVPATTFITENSLNKEWEGFIWCNPPYTGRNSKGLWLNKLANHGNGIALVPDRTNAPWWQEASLKCDLLLFTYEKIKFIKPNGEVAKQPGTGNTLFAFGSMAKQALIKAEKNKLGIILKKL